MNLYFEIFAEKRLEINLYENLSRHGFDYVGSETKEFYLNTDEVKTKWKIAMGKNASIVSTLIYMFHRMLCIC